MKSETLFLSNIFQRTMLLQLNVPATFMKVALDEGPGPPIKYQYAELGKLYQVVSLLIRSCDVSCKTQSSHVSFKFYFLYVNFNLSLSLKYGNKTGKN